MSYKDFTEETCDMCGKEYREFNMRHQDKYLCLNCKCKERQQDYMAKTAAWLRGYFNE